MFWAHSDIKFPITHVQSHGSSIKHTCTVSQSTHHTHTCGLNCPHGLTLEVQPSCLHVWSHSLLFKFPCGFSLVIQYAFILNILSDCPLIILTCVVTSCLHVLSYCFPIKLTCMSSSSTRRMDSLWVKVFQQELQNGRSLILHSSCIDYIGIQEELSKHLVTPK